MQDGALGSDDPEVIGSGPLHAKEAVCGAPGLGGPGRPVPFQDGVKENVGSAGACLIQVWPSKRATPDLVYGYSRNVS